MSRPQSPIVCDGPGCGKQKQEANHWWTVTTSLKSPALIIWPCGDPRMRHTGDRTLTAHDFCGTSCALKFISEQMGKAGEQNAKV